MLEQIIKLDPNFAPAFNMLGYAKIETGTPDSAKAVAYLNVTRSWSQPAKS